MVDPIRFDESLGLFAQTVCAELGDDGFASACAVRDAYGRLGYLPANALKQNVAARLAKEIRARIGEYALKPTPVLDPSAIGLEALRDTPKVWRHVQLESGTSIWIDLIDRRIVGQDWLSPPGFLDNPLPPRLVCASMKGGVGRSTALCVLAIHLAQLGQNVLVVDADLEAPGLGSLLLPGDSRPEYGVIDYLVENGLNGWNDTDLERFIGTSLLTDRIAGQGLVDVAPAVGRKSMGNPADMLAKLSRAMLEDPSDSGPKALRTQLRDFIDRMAGRRSYGAILIDARAGLSEIAAGAMLGLGATVFLFGVNQSQTFEDYRYLLAHLARLPASNDADNDWRRKIRFVHSKADPQGDDIASFKDRLYDVLSEEFYEIDVAGDGEAAFVYSLDDVEAPHNPLVINFDFPYMRFDPVLNAGQVRKETYSAGFGIFVEGALSILGLRELK